jgi:drug/metabolite transporter (DMT)-like permease
MLGGLLVVIVFAFPSLVATENPFNWSVFIKWGPILALFGTILPPLFFTAGMPKINVGIGAIISAIELPVAVIMGYFVLAEEQDVIKWAGITLIIAAIVLMNMKKASKALPS